MMKIEVIERDNKIYVSLDSLLDWMRSLQESADTECRKETVHDMMMIIIRCKNSKQ